VPVTPLNGVLLLLLIAVGIGALVTVFPALTLPKATGILLGFATWRYLLLSVHSRRHVAWAFGGLMCLGLGIGLLGGMVTMWPVKVPALSSLILKLQAFQSALPGLPEPLISANQFGGAMVFYLPLAMSYLLDGFRDENDGFLSKMGPALLGSKIKIGLAGAACVLLSGLLLLTQSRSAWVGALVGGGVLLTLWSLLTPASVFRRFLRLLLAFVLLIMVLVGLWIGPERWQSLLDDPDLAASLGGTGTLDFRQEVWTWALVAVQNFPFTGCGLGTFREVRVLLYPMTVPPSYDIAHAHNIFLQTALDIGIPGLVAYLALLGLIGVMGLRIAVRKPEYRVLIFGLLAGFVALHSYGMTDALALGSKPGIIFWYALGLLTAVYRVGFLIPFESQI
jgi:putative inorganic carbon (HCO3(-)) transporter